MRNREAIILAVASLALGLIIGLLVPLGGGGYDGASTLITTDDGQTEQEVRDNVHTEFGKKHESQQKNTCKSLATQQDDVKIVTLGGFDFDYVRAAWFLSALAHECEGIDF